MSIFNEFFKKEKPVFTGITRGLGGFGFGAGGGGGDPFISASGGNVDGLEPGNGYKYHTFTSPGTLTVVGTGNFEVLIVGGGGAGAPGGGAAGGGGGAGGLTYIPLTSQPGGSYPVVVGSGLADDIPTGDPTYPVAARASSIFGNTADGGGAGSYNVDAQAGGSGGGGGYNASGGGTTGNGTGNSGGNGLDGADPAYAGGGGGGAGAAGNPGSPEESTTRSDGGDGLQYPQFEGTLIGVPALAPLNGYYAGGGGGGIRERDTADRAVGGAGGGGAGGTRSPVQNSGVSGVANSGGGGGGSSNGPAEGAGGSGIVVVRYPVS